MSKISIQNLTFGYDGGYTDIFKDVSLDLDTDWKLGLVGRNGRGKTTLFNLLLGKYEYRGKIIASVDFKYFPFEVKDGDRLSWEIANEICPAAEQWEIIRELSLLQVDCEILYRPFSVLSGGERTKLLLAALFLNDNGFLLIDEPTDHLDAVGRRAVADYMRHKKGFIVVSHDRAFLDGCVDHILAINKTGIELSGGNFSSWLEKFEARQAGEAARNERLKKEISRLTETARRTAEWSDKAETAKFGKNSAGLHPDRGYVGHKAAKVMKRAKAAQSRVQTAAAEKQELLRDAESDFKLKMFVEAPRAERVLSAVELAPKYGDRAVCRPVDLELRRGERILIEGKNGCGKSSLLKIFAGEQIAHDGILSVASGLTVSYVPQTAEGLCGSLSDFAATRHIDESLFKTVLRKMGFDRSVFDTDISDFSQGQKKKTLLACSLCENAHLFIWDEPLNYTDIYTRIQLERLLNEFRPTMIFTEHDKAFAEAVATRAVKIVRLGITP